MAAQAQINPISFNDNSIRLLTLAAASDAKHDFDSFFVQIFNKFKEIGTKKTPTEYEGEHPTFHEFLSDEGRAKIHSVRDKFNDDIFKDGDIDIDGITLNKAFGENTTYNLYVRDFDKFKSADDFFIFLENRFPQEDKFYIQQDATSIGIKEKLAASSDLNGRKQKTVFLLNSREGQNDPAGKTTEHDKLITGSTDKSVKVAILNEVKNTKKVYYPSLDEIKVDRSKDVTNNFNSVFNIEISPIIEETGKDKIKRVSLFFRDNEKKLIGSTNKGKSENAINNLKNVLKTFWSLITSRDKKSSADKHSYFQSLQQKRGGDWFQILCTFDKDRFGLGEQDSIVLLTHDIIALSYALANGVNVLFTYLKAGKSYLLLFQNTKQDKTLGYSKYLANLEAMMKGLSEGEASDIKENIRKYTVARRNLKTLLNEKIEAAKEGMKIEKLASIDQSNISTAVAPKIQEFLTAYFNYAYYLNLFPDITMIVSDFYDVTADGEATENATLKENIQNLTNLLNTYSNKFFEALKKTPDGTQFQGHTIDKSNLVGYDKGGTEEYTYNEYITYRELIKQKPTLAQYYKDFLETISLDNMGLGPLPKKAELAIIQGDMEKMNKFYGKYFSMLKVLKSYGVNGNYSFESILNYRKKTKSKDLDSINAFLKNLNPFVISIDKESAETKLTVSTNRFSQKFKGVGLDLFSNKAKLVENDYSVFNYFIGNQIEEAKKADIITNLQTITRRITDVENTPNLLPRTREKITAFKAQYGNFVKEVEFHLGKKDIDYTVSLLTDIVAHVQALISSGEGGGAGAAAGRGAAGNARRARRNQVGGAVTADDIKKVFILLNANIKKTADKYTNIDDIKDIFSTSGVNFAKEFGLSDKDWGIKKTEIFNILGEFDEDESADDDNIVTQAIRTYETEKQTHQAEKEARNQAQRQQAAATRQAWIAWAQGKVNSVLGTVDTTTPNTIDPDTNIGEEILDQKAVEPLEIAELDEAAAPSAPAVGNDGEPPLVSVKPPGHDFVQSSPVAIYHDMLVNLREKAPAADLSTVDVNGTIANLSKNPAENGRGQAGGDRSPYLSIPSTMKVPYLGWTTLYFHSSTTMQIIQEYKTEEELSDFHYLSRLSQLMLALQRTREHLMEQKKRTIGGTRTRKRQRGAGGQGSPNQTVAQTVVTQPTAEAEPSGFANLQSKVDAQNTQLLNRLNLILYDYSLGNDCDAILTYFLPRLGETSEISLEEMAAALQVGISPLWLSSFICNTNDLYFNWGYDKKFEEKPYISATFKTFKNTFLKELSSMPLANLTLESHIENQETLQDLTTELVESMQETEHSLMEVFYKKILLNQLDAQKNIKIKEMGKRGIQLKNVWAFDSEAYKARNAILSLPYETFENLIFLQKNNLIPVAYEKRSGPPSQSKLLRGGSRKKRSARLKSRNRTHKKI